MPRLRHRETGQVIDVPDDPVQAEVLAKAGWKPDTAPDRHPAFVEDPADRHKVLTVEELRDELDDTIAQVREAVAAGDRARSDRLIRHVVHNGVTPTDVVLAYAQPAEPVKQRARRRPTTDQPADQTIEES